MSAALLYEWRRITSIRSTAVLSVLFLLASAVLVAVSLATPAPDPQRIGRFLWTRDILRDESADLAALPWWQNYRTLSILLLVFTAVFVWVWR